MNPWGPTLYVLGVFLGLVVFMLAFAFALGIYLGVSDARAYYREHPHAVPPDTLTARLMLWGVR